MTRDTEAIKVDLDSLSPTDFDWNLPAANGWERLSVLCDELARVGDVHVGGLMLFRLLERLADCDLGSPGPVVHTFESMAGYEALLRDSIARVPTPLSVWMVNRLLNSKRTDAEIWLDLLRSVENHPRASELTRSEARDFLNHQAGRR